MNAPRPRNRVTVIVNPCAAGGRAARRWKKIQPALEAVFGPVAVLATGHRGHAIPLAAQAAADGCDLIVAVGGDGTVNEVVNGLLAAGEPAAPLLGLIPCGSGSDFCRTLGTPRAVAAAIETLRRGRSRSIDAMRVTYRTPEGAEAVRYALNIVSFGLGGRVAAAADRGSKPLGGAVAFLTAVGLKAIRFQGDRVSLTLDGGQRIPDVLVTNVAIGNGQYHGGGMRVCPEAVIDDGWLDVTVIERMSAWEIARGSPFLYNGRIHHHPKVRCYRTRTLRTDPGAAASLEIDGEPLGRLPLEVAVRPGALRLVAP